MFKSLKRSAKGAAVPHEKGTAGMATVTMATPAHVIIPMSMHIGAPAEPVVKKGDQVCVGTLIGKAGAGAEEIKAIVSKIAKDKQVTVNIVEVKQPDMDAQLVAEAIAAQLEKRVSFRRAMRQCMGKATRSGAKGIKTMVSGRLDGAEIARCEQYHEGSIPLHTLRADIDYGFARALTTFGVIGVKVWIYRGEILPKKKKTVKKEVTE